MPRPAGSSRPRRSIRKQIGKVFAGKDGIVGALTEELIDTSQESRDTIRGLKYTPAGAFGSARFKLKGLDKNRAEYERLIEVFKAHDIGYFFYNGGNDSMDTALKVSQIGTELGYPITCVGVPKTVDNDLPHTDCCPGFGSVAKYIAVATREAALDVASMARTSTKVFVLEVMGRHAGWIAAAGGLAGKKAGEPPHIILFPEIAFDKDNVPREGEAERDRQRLLRDRRVRGRRLAGRQVPRRSRDERCVRSHTARRCRPGRGEHGARRARLQIPLGRCGLSAARGPAHRVEGRCRAGLCGGQGRRRARREGRERA